VSDAAHPVDGGTAFPTPEVSPGFVLWRATLVWQRAVAAALAPLDLTHVQFVLLACAWWLDGDPRQADIAGQAGTDAVMTSEVLRRLERKGLVERRPDPSDARARRIRVTPEGVALARRAVAAVESVDAAVLGELDPGVIRVLGGIAGIGAPETTTGPDAEASGPVGNRA
jgi:DNA-binding MarR family transcriptional regulator